MQRVLVTCVTLSLFATLAGQAPADYVFTTIDVPGGLETPFLGSQAFGINDAGQIVGSYYVSAQQGPRAFLLSNGTYTPFTAFSQATQALSINNAGQIVGAYGNDPTLQHGFLLSGGSYTSFDAPASFGNPSLGSPFDTHANGISNAGQIVGWFMIPAGKGHVDSGGFLLSGSNYTDLTLAVPGTHFNAQGINSQGQIVGRADLRGYLLSGGAVTQIQLPGGDSVIPNAINDAGDIVGAYGDGTGYHGFLLSNGVYSTLDFPGGAGTIATGINNTGDIVGYYFDAAGAEHAFFATPAPVPEPPAVALLTIAAMAMLGWITSKSHRLG